MPTLLQLLLVGMPPSLLGSLGRHTTTCTCHETQMLLNILSWLEVTTRLMLGTRSNILSWLEVRTRLMLGTGSNVLPWLEVTTCLMLGTRLNILSWLEVTTRLMLGTG